MHRILTVLLLGIFAPYLAGCGDDGFLKPLRELSDKLAPEAAQQAIKRHKEIAGIDDRSFLKTILGTKQELIISMLQKGADPNAQDEKGRPALIIYLTETKFPNPETVDAFLKAGADVNAVTEKGIPLLAEACAISPKMTQTVLAHGAKLDTADENGYTPLMYCAQVATSPDTIQLLLQAGADPTFQTLDGQTALSIAKKQNRNPAIAKTLAAVPAPVYPASY